MMLTPPMVKWTIPTQTDERGLPDADPATATVSSDSPRFLRALNFEILNAQTLTVDGDAPDLGTPEAVTGHAWGGSPAKHSDWQER